MTVPQRGDHELSRVYSEGAWPEPRRQIDDAILEASRRAARARHPVLHRWGPPLALAATVVLGISLALLVTENESMRDAGGLLRPQEPVGARAAKKREAAAPATPAPGAEAPRAEPPPARELFSSPMGPTESKPAPASKAPPAAPALTPPALAKRTPPPAAAKSAAPQPPAPAPQRTDRIRRELDQLEENRQTREAAAAAPASQAADAAAPAGVGDVRSIVAAPVARSPESWLDDIRKLRSAGRSADAERELAEFRKRYPDYRVPDDLR
jgi:hypothetical protein